MAFEYDKVFCSGPMPLYKSLIKLTENGKEKQRCVIGRPVGAEIDGYVPFELTNGNTVQVPANKLFPQVGAEDSDGLPIFEGDVIAFHDKDGAPAHMGVFWSDQSFRYIVAMIDEYYNIVGKAYSLNTLIKQFQKEKRTYRVWFNLGNPANISGHTDDVRLWLDKAKTA